MNCLNCKKETKNPKFCSRSCAQSTNNRISPKRITTRICSSQNCDKTVLNYRTMLCNEHKNKRENRIKHSQNKTIGELILKKDRKSDVHSFVRTRARSDYKYLLSIGCYNCKYNKHVEICHIKPIKDFDLKSTVKEINDRNNIVQLCRNCHWEFDHGLLDFPEFERLHL